MDFLIFANTTINTQSYLIHMKRFILPLLIIILILTSLPTKANNEIESLLKTLDKSLQHKSVYTKQKQRQIDSLKIVLRQSDNIQEKIGIAPVSYTHLDVYKRQIMITLKWMYSSKIK